MGEAGGVTAQPSPPAAPAWAWWLRRSRLSRRGCGSRWLSSSDTVTPAAGAHTICSHSSHSCPQTARGATLLPDVGAAAQRHSWAGTGSRAGRDGWRGPGQAVRRLDTTLGHDTGNVTGEGCASAAPHAPGSPPPCPGTLTQGSGCATSKGTLTPCHRSVPCTTPAKRVCNPPLRCCFWGGCISLLMPQPWEAVGSRVPLPATPPNTGDTISPTAALTAS